MDDTTAPADTNIPRTDDNYVQLKGLSKEWRRRYRHARQQQIDLEIILKRLDEERQQAQKEREEMEEKSRLELEEEKKSLDLQVEWLRRSIQQVAEENSDTNRHVDDRHKALTEEFQNMVKNLQEAMSASLLEQEAQKEKAEATLKEVEENEEELRAWEEEQESRVVELRTEYDNMLEKMAEAFQKKKTEEQQRYEKLRQEMQERCLQLRTDMKDRYERMRFELDERQGRMTAKHVKESKELERLTDLARLRVREAEQELAMVLMTTEHAKQEVRMLRRKFFPSEDPKKFNSKKKTKVPRQEMTGDLNTEIDRLVRELGMRVQEFNQIEVLIELHLAKEEGDDSCTQDGDLSAEEEMARLEAALDFKLREIEALQRRLRDKQIHLTYGRSDSKANSFGGNRRSTLLTGSGPPATSGGKSDVSWDSGASVVPQRSDDSLSPWRQRSLTPLSPISSPPGDEQGESPLDGSPSSSRVGLSSGIGSLNHSWNSSVTGEQPRRLVRLRAPSSAPVFQKGASGRKGTPRCSSSPSLRTKDKN